MSGTLQAPSQYLLDHDWDHEGQRLALLEHLQDPVTRRRITELGIGPGARCLEVGAGRGSVARWLGDWVAPLGSVTAIDLELTFLDQIEGENIEAHQMDVLVDEPPGGPFDFIHCRAVLMHIPERRRALSRMVSWLAPGGWLLCEEPDWALALTSPREMWTRTFLAYQQALPTMDFGCGRALVSELTAAGLDEVDAEAELDIVRAGTPEAEWYRLSVLALEEPVLGSGALTRQELEDAQALLEEPGFCEPGFVFFGVSGRNPV